LTVASTSSCTFTVTWWVPRDLIGLPRTILRLSIAAFSPAAELIAPAMSLTVTAPNRRPPAPERTGSLTVVPSSLA
jgi:hypothetical protein